MEIKQAIATLAIVSTATACKPKGAPAPTRPPASFIDPGPGPLAEDPLYSVVNEPAGEVWPIRSTEFLALVPAQTPYVYANLEPLPDTVLDTLQPLVDATMKAADRSYQESLRDSDPQKAQNLREVLGDTFSVETFRQMGLDFSAPYIVYGLGLAPVGRLRLGNAKRFAQTVERVRALKSESKLRSAVFHGQVYWYVPDDDGTLTVFAVVGPDLVIAVLPPGEVQRDVLPLVFGQKVPKQSMANTAEFTRTQQTHGLMPHFVGFVNLQVLARTRFGRSPRGLERDVAVAYKAVDHGSTPECVDDFIRIAGWFPKVVFGFDAFSRQRTAGSLILEADPAIAGPWATITAPIPGLADDRKQGGLTTMGVGLNVERATTLTFEVITALQRDPLQCASFSALQEAVAKFPRDASAIPPWVYSLSGASLVVQDIEVSDGQGLTKVDASAVLGTRDARAILEAVAQFMPDGTNLAALDRPGKAVALKDVFPDNDTAVTKTSRVGYNKAGIGWTSGRHAKRRLKRVLSVQRPPDGTLSVMTMDVAQTLEKLPGMHETAFGSTDDPDVRRWLLDFFNAIDRVTYRLALTEAGAEIEIGLESRRKPR